MRLLSARVLGAIVSIGLRTLLRKVRNSFSGTSPVVLPLAMNEIMQTMDDTATAARRDHQCMSGRLFDKDDEAIAGVVDRAERKA